MFEWTSIVTLVIGWGLAQGGTWLGTLHEARVRREERAEERRERQADEQRQTLLDLQDALHRLAGATGAIYSRDRAAYIESGEWHVNRFSPELSEAHREAVVSSHVLAVRVADDVLRMQVQRLRELCSGMVQAKTLEDADRLFEEGISLLETINERIGEILRTT